MQDKFDVIIIGAGVIGCITARSLARDHDVLVVERDSIAGGTSKLAGASVSSSRYISDLPVVAGHINQWFRNYSEAGRIRLTMGRDFEPVRPDQVTDERARVAELVEQGYPVSFVDSNELADRCPKMDFSDFGGAVSHGDYAWVDPIEYIHSLAEEARQQGATIRTGVEVTDLQIHDDSVVGVETPNGVLTANSVVAAAGWQTGDLLPDDVSFPMRPYITQGCEIVVDFDVNIEKFPTVRVPVESGEGSIYQDNQETLLIRPKKNGNLRVAGGHNMYKRDEYDYLAANNGTEAEQNFIESVRETLPDLLMNDTDIKIIDDWAGTGGGLTPDTRPVIDVPEALDNLVVATGFRAGFILSPIAGQASRSLITGENCPFNLAPFAIDRF